MSPDPQKLLAMFERGIVTQPELVGLLIHAAVEHPPAVFADGLPAEVVESIREKANQPPDTRWISIRGGTYRRDVEPDAVAAREREQLAHWQEGLSRWRDYFTQAGS